MALSSKFTVGFGTTVIGGLDCDGREFDINECQHSGWRGQICERRAYVICEGKLTQQITIVTFLSQLMYLLNHILIYSYRSTYTMFLLLSTGFHKYEELVFNVSGDGTAAAGMVKVVQPYEGTLCCEGWDVNDARVLCRTLNLPWVINTINYIVENKIRY